MTSTSVEVVFFEAKGESYKARIQKRNHTCYNLNYRDIGYIDPDTEESKEVKGELDFNNKDDLITFLQSFFSDDKGGSSKARIQKRNYTCYNLNYRNIGYIDPDTKESKEVKGELDFINKDALIMFLQNVWESYGKKYRACEYRLLRMHNDSYQCLFRIVEDKFDKDRFLKYLSAHDNLKSERVIDDLLILSVADFFLDGLPSSSEEEEEEIEQKEDAEVSPDN